MAAARESENLWDRIRAGYGMAPLDSPLIARHERWFASNPAYIERMVKRASLYLYHIVEEVDKRGIPMEIALLPAIESAYKAHAYSRARASGLWQFIPSTGRLYGLDQNWWYDGRRDVMAATNAALNYLQKLEKDFDGDWHLALAAYNAGEGRVMRARRHNEKRGRSTKYTALRTLKPETLNYVPKLLAIANIIADPERLGPETGPARCAADCSKTITTLPRPSKRRPNVAVVSSDGMDVDLHLGHAIRILIYGPREDGLACLLETRPAPAPGSGGSRWEDLADTLSDCFILLAASAGKNPREILSRRGIQVFITEDNIEGTVDVLYGGGKKRKKG